MKGLDWLKRSFLSRSPKISKDLMIQRLDEASTPLWMVGHVENVLFGKVPDVVKHKRYLAQAFQSGFEAGSPMGFLSLGEALAFNGILYASRTDRRDVEQRLVWGTEFVTSSFCLIPKGATPSWKVTGNDLQLDLDTLYSQLLSKVQKPYAFTGTIEFREAMTIELTSPAIYDEPIFDQRERYFAEPYVMRSDITGVVMGVVSDFYNHAFDTVNKDLRKVLYHNPVSDAQQSAAHAHMIATKEWTLSSEMHPDKAVEVYHLFPPSKVRRIDLDLFPIQHVQDVTDTLECFRF